MLFKLLGGLLLFVFSESGPIVLVAALLGLLFLGSVSFDGVLYHFVTTLEFGNHLIFGQGISFKPNMVHHLLHGESVLWLELEEALN